MYLTKHFGHKNFTNLVRYSHEFVIATSSLLPQIRYNRDRYNRVRLYEYLFF